MAASTSTTKPSTPTRATDRVLARGISAHAPQVVHGEAAGRHGAVAGDQADDVDADPGAGSVVRGGPAPGQASQSGGLGRGDGFERGAEDGAAAGLDLADDVAAPVVGHDVDLADGAAPVAV